jgi:glycosyltransferase involved in cell wall biosynthesis
MPETTRVLTVVGDPNRIGAWSGIPYFFLRAAKEQGFLSAGLSLQPENLRRRRLFWNLARVLRGSRPGGFQYTEAFLRRLFAQARSRDDEEIEIISHFPLLPPRPWRRGWRVSYYIDATLRQNFIDYGLARRTGRKAREDALRRELEHYQAAERIVCMSRWAARSVVEDYGIPSSKVHVILPGANLRDCDVTAPAEPPPLDPLRLGFIGKDWRRKGLPFLLQVAEELARRKIGVRVVALGPPAADLPSHPLLEPAGFVDKEHDVPRFVRLVRSFHFGCLFASAEACGIANLECLRLGVPVLASRVGGVRSPICCNPSFATALPILTFASASPALPPSSPGVARSGISSRSGRVRGVSPHDLAKPIPARSVALHRAPARSADELRRAGPAGARGHAGALLHRRLRRYRLASSPRPRVAGAHETKAGRPPVGASAAARDTFPQGATGSPRVIRGPGAAPVPAPATLPQRLDRA